MLSTLGYYVCVPFAWLVRLFYTLTSSYGLALIFFTLVIKLVMLPFQMKSKKGMIRMSRVSGRMQELQKQYKNNPQRYQQARPGSYGSYSGGTGAGGAQDNPFSGFGFDGFGFGFDFGSQQQRQYDTSQDSSEFQAAWHFIVTGEYQQALDLLNRMNVRERNARWYYLSGLTNSGLGNKILALQHLQQAVRMDPSNYEYRQALLRMQSGSQFYQNNGGADFCACSNPGNWCLSMCLLNVLCNSLCCSGGYGGYGGYGFR